LKAAAPQGRVLIPKKTNPTPRRGVFVLPFDRGRRREISGSSPYRRCRRPERCRLSPVPPPREHQTRGQPIEPVLQFAFLSDEPRFRRRPPSSTRAGDAIQTNIALIGIRPRRPLRRALDINYRSRRCSEEKNYFFFFFAFLAFFAFFAFFAMLPSKQLSELAMS
jgi:hypothetical protein